MLTVTKQKSSVSKEIDTSKKLSKSRKYKPKTDKLKQYLSGSTSPTNKNILDNTSTTNVNISLSINQNQTESIKITTSKQRTDTAQIVKFNDPRNIKQFTSDNGKDQKIIEFYMDCLQKHKTELNKDKLTVWMQVGSFYEVYGLIYPDGTKQGNVWDVASNLDIKVANKKQSAYDNPDIKVYMAGIKDEYADPYLETLIDKYGWTVAVYSQEKISGSNKFSRVLKKILSPGINFESDNVSNNYMYIYFKSNHSRLLGNVSLNIGMFYVDCISGENGIQELYSKDINDCNVVLTEIVKLLTIKNPSEVVIHMDIENYNVYHHLSKEECYGMFGLYDRNVNFIVETCPREFYSSSHQKLLLENVYNSYKGRGNILDNLELEGRLIYGRVVLCLALNNINQYDSNIISYLEKPNVLQDKSSYLMLANNCLQQLDIINCDSNTKVSMLQNDSSLDNNNTLGSSFIGKRKALLDILDKTKTVMGRRMFRSRLSMPIIDEEVLEQRYKEIEILQLVQKQYLNTSKNPDIILSPYSTMRTYLSNIKDISKILRKIITQKCFPSDIVTLSESLDNFIQLHNTLKEYITNVNSYNSKIYKDDNTILEYNIAEKFPLLTEEEINECININTRIKEYFNFDTCIGHWALFNNSFFITGKNKKIDEFQDALFKDRDFFLLFKKSLTSIINPDINSQLYNENIDDETLNKLLEINEGNNSKLNKYLHCSDKNMKKIKEYIDTNPNGKINIGNYDIKLNSIEFSQIRKGVNHIKTPYIDIASRNYVTNLEELKRICIKEFKDWCQSFYIDNNIYITSYIKWIANIDVIQSCAIISDKYGYSRPIIAKEYKSIQSEEYLADNDEYNSNKSYINVKGLRHPIIEQYLHDNKYIPNDITLGKYNDITLGNNNEINNSKNNDEKLEQDGILLFGLNAAGKSSLSKSIGIAVIMAQAGMFVACNKMEFKPYKYLFTRIRNNDDIYAGLSSFEVEMKEFKVILDYANSDSLILGDELCSGTETLDATALMASGLQQLCKRRASFIFATHLHFLTELDCINDLKNLNYYHLAVNQDVSKPGKLIYERKLKPGNGPQSYGILVCKSMKLDNEFVKTAELIRGQIERGEVLKFDNRLTETNLVNQKYSKYNTEKIFQNCEICGKKGEDIHHINMQCSANQSGVITTDNLKFHKNEKWNLVCLCKGCHQDVHSLSKKLIINGYIETSTGKELDYIINNSYSNKLNNSNSVYEINTNTKYISSSNKNDVSFKSTLSQEMYIKEFNVDVYILTLFNQGKTTRSIQRQLRESKHINISLRDIETKIKNSFN